MRIAYYFYILPLFLMVGCEAETPPPQLTPVKYASTAAIVEAPAHIAQAKNYFGDEGLDFDLTIYPDGRTSLEKVISGEADIGAVMSTPLVYKSFQTDNFTIIANLLHGKIHFAVVSTQSNINSPSDFLGKKIGVTKGTSGEYFMDSFFVMEDINRNDNQILYSTANESVKALSNGSIDAIFSWVPWPFLALDQLQDQGKLLETSKIVPSSWVIIANKDFAQGHPDTLSHFIKGLQKGIDFSKQEKKEAYKLHTNTTGFSSELLTTLFSEMDFSLSLSNRLLVDLEQQAKWIIDKGYVNQGTVPNYLNFIDSSPLKAVFPSDVTLITQ